MPDRNSPPSLAFDRMPTGIDEFDHMTRGGLPRERTTVISGGPGTGKTIFGLQTLVNGLLCYGEPGLFVAFEENAQEIMANAASFGWDLPSLAEKGLYFLDARLSPDTFAAGPFDLSGMLGMLEAKAREMGARRIVFDSIDVLLTLMGDPAAERQELYRVRDWLAHSGLTGLITTRPEEETPYLAQHWGYMQFMADCLVRLRHYFSEHVSLRELRIEKYRGSSFEENEVPFVISATGLELVGSALATGITYPASVERVSTGVQRLDTMLEGGYYRGSSVLITGAPGTAKSTLSASFVQSACRRGERALYLSFDESPAEIVRNMASVGIDLAPHIESGLLRMISILSETDSAPKHLMTLRNLMREHQPACLVIDPLSAMVRAGGQTTALAVARWLLHWTKSRAITLVCTSLLESTDPLREASEIGVSTIADTWIHLSYVAQGGERNRALTIVKSRGTAHSNQVRELVLSDQGVTLTDVYLVEGNVLMGTMRAQKEEAERFERERARAQVSAMRLEIQRVESDISSRIEVLKRELEAKQADLRLFEVEQAARLAERQNSQKQLEQLRRVD